MKLSQSEKNLYQLFQCINAPIIWLTLDYKIIDLNRTARAIYHWKKKEVAGKKYLQLCKEHGFICPIFRKLSLLAKKKCIKDIETTINYKNDEEKKVISWTVVLDKKHEKIILIGNDISRLKKTEEKNFQLDSIIARMPGNVYWYDKNFEYLGCNENSAKTFGQSREKLIGKNLYGEIVKEANITKKGYEDFRRYDLEVMRTGIPKFNIEDTPFMDATGEMRYFLTNRVPLFDQNGKVYGLLGISTDISERKKLEQALIEAKEQADLANEAKSNFLAIMSHELRTPLNAILGIAQVLQKKDLNHAQAEQIDIILRAGDFLLALINDILDFSKLEAGKLDIIYEKFDLYKLTQDIAISMRQLTENKDLQLLVKYSDKAPRTIVADPRRVRQIIMNFISNAVKFTDRGHIKLVIKPNKNNNKIKVSLEDTGIGIPKSKMNQVFERFTQLDSRYSRKYGGAGLGLAICKQLIENMGGKIGVKSEYHKGSKFWFTIPLTLQPARSKKAKEDTLEINDTTPVKPSHILVLEDNDLSQIVVKAMLEDLRCTLDIADNGKAALKLFAKQEYDLIFSDISLPDMSGIEVIQAMRKKKKNVNSSKPIIAITAHALEEDRQNCLKAGADDVLIKPIMQPALKNILRKWIK